MAIDSLKFRQMFQQQFGNGPIGQQPVAFGFSSSTSTTQTGTPISQPIQNHLKDRLNVAAQVQDEMPDAFQWAEIQRIINLPIAREMTEREFELFCKERIRAEYYDQGFRFKQPQAATILAYELFNGALGNVPVGWGKTLISLAVAKAAFSKGIAKILLLIPPEILSQLVDTDIPWARARIGLNYPIQVVAGGVSKQKRQQICRSGWKGLYIMPYSMLSASDASENLLNIRPGLIVADEVQRLANPESARTKRVMRLMEEMLGQGQPPEMVALSGTITNKSIMEYWHLIKYCLRANNPLPNAKNLALEWSYLIDAEASREDGGDPRRTANASSGPIIPIVEWAQKHFPDQPGGYPKNVFGFRAAFKKRMDSAPGVVNAGHLDIGTSLIICNVPIEGHKQHPNWPKLQDLIDRIEMRWRTPNGDEIDHAIHKWKWLSELSAGFYNELTWPQPEVVAERKKWPLAQATDIVLRSKIQHEAQQEYHKELRDWIKDHARDGLDTPFLIGKDMAMNGSKNVGGTLYHLWKDARDLRFDYMLERDRRGVRVCDYKIRAAINWAKQLREENPKAGGVIWYLNREIGRWIYEELYNAGVQHIMHCPSGDNDRIRNPANAGHLAIASIKAHGTGKNLQHFQHQYFVQFPRVARDAEQVLGRLHRNGQMADEIVAVTNDTLVFDEIQKAACLNDALYIHQTTSRQKLIYATHSPLPKIFPASVLVQQGMENVQRLSREQEAALVERFGGFQKVA